MQRDEHFRPNDKSLVLRARLDQTYHTSAWIKLVCDKILIKWVFLIHRELILWQVIVANSLYLSSRFLISAAYHGNLIMACVCVVVEEKSSSHKVQSYLVRAANCDRPLSRRHHHFHQNRNSNVPLIVLYFVFLPFYILYFILFIFLPGRESLCIGEQSRQCWDGCNGQTVKDSSLTLIELLSAIQEELLIESFSAIQNEWLIEYTTSHFWLDSCNSYLLLCDWGQDVLQVWPVWCSEIHLQISILFRNSP